jgi:hypothetical protein
VKRRKHTPDQIVQQLVRDSQFQPAKPLNPSTAQVRTLQPTLDVPKRPEIGFQRPSPRASLLPGTAREPGGAG